jgi:hypothetical protein
MDRSEIVDLLSVISAYDNRNPSESAVHAWSKSAELGRWTAHEAAQAVHQHFASSTEFLMPAHVTALVKADRQDRHMRHDQQALEQAPPPDPAAQARIDELIAQVSEKLSWHDVNGADMSASRAALRVTCPHCGATAGNRCTGARGKVLSKSPCHPSRLEAAEAQRAS